MNKNALKFFELKTASRPLTPRGQRGFTLIEIAVVLVIIGLLLGGVLKGQELINSAKVKNLISDFRTTASVVYAYQDRFRSLPGDDPNPEGHVKGVRASRPTGKLGNGRINGLWNSTNTSEESYLFWQHVRLAGLIAGSPNIGEASYFYRNADGGRVGITGDRVYRGAVSLAATFFVCSSGVQGRYARQIDTTVDDSNTTSGSVRVIGIGEVSQSSTFINVTPDEDAELFTICVAN